VVAGSVCGTCLCPSNFRLGGPLLGGNARALPDNFRLRTFCLVVDRLSIGPGGESPYSPEGTVTCGSVFGMPPDVPISITVRPVS
jgi:hypothetical protein